MNRNCKMIRNGIEILLELLEWEAASRAAMLHMTLHWKTNKDINTHGVHLYSLRLRSHGLIFQGSDRHYNSFIPLNSTFTSDSAQIETKTGV